MKKSTRQRVKRIGWGLAILVLVVVLVLAWLPGPVPVDLGSVERGELTVTVDEDGRTRVMERYMIAAPVAGNLERIELQAGDAVQVGEEVARIAPVAPPLLDPRTRAQAEAQVATAQASVAQAQAAVEQAHEAHEFARREAERLEELYAEGVATRQALEQARFEVQSAAAQLASARLAVRIAEHQLEQAQAVLHQAHGEGVENDEAGRVAVTSPIDAEVLQVFHEGPGPVQVGTPLLETGDPTVLEIVVDVLTTSAVRIEPGDLALIERWGTDESVVGRVRRIEPSAFTQISALGVEEQRVNVILDVVEPTPRWRELGDGFRVEARIVTWHEEDVLKVDASAVFRSEEDWAVFRAVNGRVELTPVLIGERTDREVQILEGLEEGDEVVLYPGDAVVDGARVEPRS